MKNPKNEKPDIMSFAGILTDEEAEGIKKIMKEYRKSFDRSYKERQKYLKKFWRD